MNKKSTIFSLSLHSCIFKIYFFCFPPKVRALQTLALFLQDPFCVPTPVEYFDWPIFEACILTILRCVSSGHWCIPPGHSNKLYNFMALEYWMQSLRSLHWSVCLYVNWII